MLKLAGIDVIITIVMILVFIYIFVYKFAVKGDTKSLSKEKIICNTINKCYGLNCLLPRCKECCNLKN